MSANMYLPIFVQVPMHVPGQNEEASYRPNHRVVTIGDSQFVEPTWNVIYIDMFAFQININVRSYLPHELTVRHQDKKIIIKGQQSFNRYGSYALAKFTCQFDLPNGYKAEDIFTWITVDGFMNIKVVPPFNFHYINDQPRFKTAACQTDDLPPQQKDNDAKRKSDQSENNL